jgi:hypothetical protein
LREAWHISYEDQTLRAIAAVKSALTHMPFYTLGPGIWGLCSPRMMMDEFLQGWSCIYHSVKLKCHTGVNYLNPYYKKITYLRC